MEWYCLCPNGDCNQVSNLMTLEKSWGALVREHWQRQFILDNLLGFVPFVTHDLLGAKTKISFKWLASLKIGFEEDDLPGRRLRTSLKISLLTLWYPALP